jgi:hypothetical protein
VLVFWKKKLVFFAVPKTGTTALESVAAPFADTAILNPPGMKHCTVVKFERELSAFFEQKGRRKLERMAVVRRPEDWLGSWYRYRSRADLSGHENSTAEISFDRFVEAWLLENPPPYAQIGQQARFLDAISQPARVEHLFCYESLDLAVEFLSSRLGVALPLRPRNVSPTKSTSLSQELSNRISLERPAEFALWDSAKRADNRW